MKRLALLLLATALPSPAFAQHAAHTAAGAQEQPPVGPHAGHAMPPETAAGAKPPCRPEHAAMGHCTPKQTTPRPVTSATDPHAGHQMPAAPDPHAGHQMGATPTIEPPVAPAPAAALQGPENAADLFWNKDEMYRSRRKLVREHGGLTAYRVLVDRFEANLGTGSDWFSVDADAWYGGDSNKLWVKAEIEGEVGVGVEEAEVQALWSRAIDPWFDFQAGIRYDARRGPDRGYFVLGVQGLAPYWIEVDAATFVSDQGDVTARIEAEHDVRITQKLILQPRAELALALQDVPDELIGSGLSSAELGLRLRYEITPQFAPYVGYEYSRAFGDTRRFLKAAGHSANSSKVVVGIRTWF
jgi:copper resistance protein B